MTQTILRTLLLAAFLSTIGGCSSTTPAPVAATEKPWYAGTSRVAD